MNEVPIENFPPAVWGMYSSLVDETGVEPLVHRNGFGRIVVSHGNDRVRAIVTYKLVGGKWSWHSSTLTIDGRKVPIAQGGPSQYAEILKDPDYGRHRWTPKKAKKAKLPNMREIPEEQMEYIPQDAADFFKGLRGKLVDPDASVTVHMSENSEYIVRVHHPKKLSVYFFLSAHVGRWYLDRQVTVNSTGYDVSSWHDNSLDDLIDELLGTISREAQRSYLPQRREHAQAGMSNSVSVRKSTVFRI
jgi:hypothetical protein